MRKSSKGVKIVLVTLVVLVLVAAIGLIFKFTNGGTTGFTTFYVSVADKTYSTSGEYVLQDGDNRFETKYVFADNSTDKHKGYLLKVTPNTENDFWFTVGGEDEKLSSIDDYSAAFSIEKDVTGFTISYDGSSVEEILSRMYGDKDVVLDEGMDFTKTYFNLEISSSDGKSTIIVGLKLDVKVTGIELDKEGIIF